ncbi:MAG: hypothetical protein WAW13_00025 [Minisyncoccia bacterium]
MKRLFSHRTKTSFGFTLTETVVVVALFTIIMLAIMESIASFYRLNAYTIAQAYQVDNARRGVEQMVRDLREMTYADNGTFPLTRVEDYRTGFYSDIDRDNSVEYIEYSLASTTLYKKVFNATGSPLTYSTTTPESTTTLSEYVQNEIQNIPIFVYYDINGNPATATTTVTDIRYVEVSVIVNIDPIRDPGQYMLRSSAALRNLKN